MTPTHDALRELAAGYAFGTLDPAERQEFEAHLSTCPECQADVEFASEIANGLGRIPERAPLPPDLRDRVLRAATGSVQPGPGALPPSALVRRQVIPAWLAIAASLVAAVAAGTAWTEHRRLTDALEDAAREQQRTATVQAALVRAQADAAESRRAMDVMTAADVTRITLAGQAAAPQAAGHVFWSASHGLVFTAANLPKLPDDRIYQLWYVTAGAPVSAALVAPDASGRLSVVQAPADVGRLKAFALTIEPSGGVPAPTGAMYLLGSI